MTGVCVQHDFAARESLRPGIFQRDNNNAGEAFRLLAYLFHRVHRLRHATREAAISEVGESLVPPFSTSRFSPPCRLNALRPHLGIHTMNPGQFAHHVL